MNRKEALEALNAHSSHNRGHAARALAEVGQAADLRRLRKALRVETVSYVQYALQETIKSLSRKSDPVSGAGDETTSEVPEEVRRQIFSQAVEWVTGFLLHEIASPIGLVRLSARTELGEKWEGSATRRHLETVHRVFDGIEMLKSASGVPKPEEFDLSMLIDDLVATQMPQAREWISKIGQKPYIIKADTSLISLVLANGLRNAVEAVEAMEGTPRDHAVTINWGETDVDHWVSILDTGAGIQGPIDTAFQIGNSTKKNHSGFGLPIARQAIDAMIGSLSLTPAKDGGAVYLARWKK